MVLFYDGLGDGGLKETTGAGLPVEPTAKEFALCVKLFETAVDRLGQVANELDLLVQSTTKAVAEIEAQGDRIDRLQADNQVLLDELLKGR